MIKDLFIHDLRQNKIMIISIFSIILLYGSISAFMYDPNPDGLAAFQDMIDLLPEAMVKLMGFDSFLGPITQYLGSYLYGFILIMFPLIFIIIVSTKLVANHVDSGSMTYILTMPYTRTKIIMTQLLFFLISYIVVFATNIGIIILICEIVFKGLLDIPLFITLNFITLSTHVLALSIAFFFSTLFSDASKASGFTSTVLITFLVFNMLYKLGDATEFLKFLTPFSIINVNYILEGGGNGILSASFMYLASFIFMGLSILIFNKKSIII